MMFRRAVRYSRKTFGLFNELKNITDGRIKPRIATIKIAIAIFSMQLANLGSLNNFSQQVSSPSVSTIARSADTMSLCHIRDVNLKVYKKARMAKMLSPHHGRWIGVIDGKEITTSSYCKCRHCKKRKLRDKEGKLKYQYYHQFTAFILACEGFSFTLDIEPILPGEGEKTSAYRLLKRVCVNYPKAFEAVAGDGLYLAGNIFNLLRSHRKYGIAVLKDETRQLYEEALSLSDIVEPIMYTNDKTTYRVWEHKIGGLWDSYKKEVTVIRSEETKAVGDIEEKADWMWVTNLPSTGNLENMVRICHSRWQIENQCFNETVNIWALDHIYRHSESAILTFILFLFIAVNIVNIFFNRNIKDKRIKTKVFLLDLVKASLLLNYRSSLPPIPI